MCRAGAARGDRRVSFPPAPLLPRGERGPRAVPARRRCSRIHPPPRGREAKPGRRGPLDPRVFAHARVSTPSADRGHSMTHPRQLPRVGPAGLDRLAVSRPPKDPPGVENPRADSAGGDAAGCAEEAPLSPALRAGPHPGLFGPGERSGKPCGIRRSECARLLLPHGIVAMARTDQGVRDLVKDHPAHGVGVIKLGQRA